MTDPAVISGSFSKIVPVPSRNVVQLVIEIPSEAADTALKALGGYPQPSREVPVAIARLAEGITPQPSQTAALGHKTAPEEITPKPKREWRDVPLVEQAGIRCGEVGFHKWVGSQITTDWVARHATGRTKNDADQLAARWVREQCGVTSRKDILPGTPAGDAWLQLDARYLEDTQLPEQIG